MWSRTGYAISRALVIRQDSGGNTFNYDNVVGSALGSGFSNLYYPAASRGGKATLAFERGTKLVAQIHNSRGCEVNGLVSKSSCAIPCAHQHIVPSKAHRQVHVYGIAIVLLESIYRIYVNNPSGYRVG